MSDTPAAAETEAPAKTPEPAASSSSNVTSLNAWKKAKCHTITLPSGAKVEIQIPNLPKLVQTGGLPNELLDVAIQVASGKRQVNKDDILKQSEFYNKVAAITVVSPQTTEDEWASDELPFEDKEMIVEFGTRQRDLDAVGHHLGGLEKVKDFRTFRGLGPLFEDLEGVQSS